ncbi:MAG TPA: GGDEF domain-containing protein [Vicinamibacterales bacterium]|jgi:diguanylate cyclase (GGDEF)-like protein
MRIGRHEVLLIVGLFFALMVTFSRQTSRLLEATRQFEGTYGLGLLAGLAIAAITLVLFVQGRRRELQQRASVAASEAMAAQERARELERLVNFWHALTQSFDLDAICDVVLQYLPQITGSRDGWVVAGAEGSWRSVLGPTEVDAKGAIVHVTDITQGALDSLGTAARPDGIEHQGQICFPMIVAGASLGVLGIPADSPSLTPPRRLVVGAAAALLGVSVRSVQLLQEVRESSLRDSLTGCVNRAHGMEVIAAELMRARRSHLPVSMIMFDIDRFKNINDRYGHLCGDAVLAEVGAKMRASLRSSDLKCRYGGEEFLILLPETPLDGAVRAAETLRRELAELSIAWNGGIVRLTSSFGVATAHANEIDPTPLIARTDEALYLAKREGRDRVRVAGNIAMLAAS